MNTTSISWTEKTWNPISGCTPRVGPKAAGRLLDGKAWDEYPEVRSGE